MRHKNFQIFEVQRIRIWIRIRRYINFMILLSIFKKIFVTYKVKNNIFMKNMCTYFYTNFVKNDNNTFWNSATLCIRVSRLLYFIREQYLNGAHDNPRHRQRVFNIKPNMYCKLACLFVYIIYYTHKIRWIWITFTWLKIWLIYRKSDYNSNIFCINTSVGTCI